MSMLRNRLGLAGWLAAVAVAAVSFLVGFVWLPSVKDNAQGGFWDVICRAAGISRPAAPALAASQSARIPTDVTWSAGTIRAATSGDAHRGSSLAAGCAACHGPKGISAMPAFPNLAGLPAEAVYKELDDYRSGKRQNPLMQAMAAHLSDENVADLAAYFAGLPAALSKTDAAEPALVTLGSPMRSIAPCAACHGPYGHKPGAPPLAGQKGPYVKAQLDAFATGTRSNDTNQQMREVARALTASEREALADWYGERHVSN
jgi:cytochrome c553